ncbi:hypothetical protein DRN63_04415 [Nanoarchaeota archaeon]|nr:MAG: hypothetical protein DRN63_04415 [Nanoarchaeota archaeon]
MSLENKLVRINGKAVVISDLQPSYYFNIHGFKELLNDLRKEFEKDGASALIILGDIIENMDMFYQQRFITADLKRQHAFVRYLIDKLIEVTKPKLIIFASGNHDIARGGEDIGLLLSEVYRLKGHNVYYTDEWLLLVTPAKTYLLMHKLTSSWGSNFVGLTPLIRSGAYRFTRWLAKNYVIEKDGLKYGLLIDEVIIGHIHKPAKRYDAVGITVLGGWNRWKYYDGEPSTCLIINPNGSEKTLQYSPVLNLQENETEMYRWVEEVFNKYLKQVIRPTTKIEEIKQNNNNGNNHDDKPRDESGDLDENPFRNFVRKQYEKYAKNDIEESFRELPWRIEKNSEKPKIVFSARNEIPLIVLQQALSKFGIETVLDEDRFKLELKEEGIIKLLQTDIDEKIKRRILFELGKLGVLSRNTK